MYDFYGDVSNPSRDYSAFLRSVTFLAISIAISFQTLPGIIPRFYEISIRYHKPINNGFKPFQGLFRVSTALTLRLFPLTSHSFKPFQGLFRVSTYAIPFAPAIPRSFQTLPGIIPRFYCHRDHCPGDYSAVSNPSRDYSAFLHSRTRNRYLKR
ncbi:hypothetical protein U27_01544 [Candidatus Vecturithrix granuli]|uniref:Uncharacterized protein n=1 Tax=Vecturithrix granuli TaxID=1499967 RepID=A0A081CAN8_VECG1|nr:hypothetical protein U27_01544 [Candidatus Vecturithrix granuli]